MPLISIITPAYNSASFLPQTIASVQAQSVTDWEMLIVDDASTDNSAEIVELLAAQDPRLILIRQPHNQGPAAARQAAITRAQGRYLAFLDSDDLWLPEKLARQLSFMAEKKAALSYTSLRRISEDGTQTGEARPIPPSLTYSQLLKNTAIACSTAIIDRELSGPVAIIEGPIDDYTLWLSILKRGLVAHGLNEDLTRYRARIGSLSGKPIRCASWVWWVLRKVEKLPLPYAIWCFAHFAVRAVLKRLTF